MVSAEIRIGWGEGGSVRLCESYVPLPFTSTLKAMYSGELPLRVRVKVSCGTDGFCWALRGQTPGRSASIAAAVNEANRRQTFDLDVMAE